MNLLKVHVIWLMNNDIFNLKQCITSPDLGEAGGDKKLNYTNHQSLITNSLSQSTTEDEQSITELIFEMIHSLCNSVLTLGNSV
jgi:hypothetical protein